MTAGCRLVLTVAADPLDPQPLLDYRTLKSLMDRTPEVQAGPDGSRLFVYQMTGEEIARMRSQARQDVDLPTPDGLAACLSALAREAQDLGLGQAAWAIDLAMQMIRLQQIGGDRHRG